MREIRAFLRENDMPLDPELIATGLVSYSQRGADYVNELIQMMRVNRKYIVETSVLVYESNSYYFIYFSLHAGRMLKKFVCSTRAFMII